MAHASATTTTLVDLPDAALLLILESVAPKQLARVCLICHDLARLAREEALWAAHCQAAIREINAVRRMVGDL